MSTLPNVPAGCEAGRSGLRTDLQSFVDLLARSWQAPDLAREALFRADYETHALDLIAEIAPFRLDLRGDLALAERILFRSGSPILGRAVLDVSKGPEPAATFMMGASAFFSFLSCHAPMDHLRFLKDVGVLPHLPATTTDILERDDPDFFDFICRQIDSDPLAYWVFLLDKASHSGLPPVPGLSSPIVDALRAMSHQGMEGRITCLFRRAAQCGNSRLFLALLALGVLPAPVLREASFFPLVQDNARMQKALKLHFSAHGWARFRRLFPGPEAILGQDPLPDLP